MAQLVGKLAPTFGTLLDQDGRPFDSTAIIGKQPLCLFFYPNAMTYCECNTSSTFRLLANSLVLSTSSVCTKEACAFRDISDKPTFSGIEESKSIRIIGISSNEVEKQKKFAMKNNLNYTVLADTNKEARKAFNVAGSALMGIAPRMANSIT